MKIRKTIASLFVLVFVSLAIAQTPVLKITPPNSLQLFGNAGNYYQFESSNNLVDWNASGTTFSILTNPYTASFTPTSSRGFFRARVLVSATNSSYITTCPENDNVMVFFRGDIKNFSITATHPTYAVTDYTLWPDFVGCNGSATYPNYPFSYLSNKISDGGSNYDTIWVYSDTTFWRPTGMTVSVNGNASTKQFDVQRMVLVRYIPGSSGEWPNFFVLYCDGNMRLIPFPPVGHPYVSYGSSVIIGPASMAYSNEGTEARPLSEISSIDYRTASKTMLVTYKNGGTATLDVNDVTRNHATVKVTINYPTDKPFCTLRSNFVTSGTCDTSTVIWKDLSNNQHTDSVMSFSGIIGNNWFFTRPTPSITRNSSPDILISLP